MIMLILQTFGITILCIIVDLLVFGLMYISRLDTWLDMNHLEWQ